LPPALATRACTRAERLPRPHVPTRLRPLGLKANPVPAAITPLLWRGSKSTCAEQFELWQGKHRKAYGSSAEHKRRLRTFCKSLREIDEINSRPGVTWRAATNPYSDLTWEEFAASKLMAAQVCAA